MTRGTTWTQEEIKYLKDNWKTATCKEIAAAIGRKEQACFDKAYKLKLKKKNCSN